MKNYSVWIRNVACNKSKPHTEGLTNIKAKRLIKRLRAGYKRIGHIVYLVKE